MTIGVVEFNVKYSHGVSEKVDVGTDGLVVGVGLGGGLSYLQHRAPLVERPGLGSAYCDHDISTAKAQGESEPMRASGAVSTPTPTQTGWIPKLNHILSHEEAPAGMAWIPGGQFWTGATEDQMADARPWHRVYVDRYWMGKTDVTNEQFAKFVKARGYATVAERKPSAEDYPKAPPENLVAGSVVFSPPDHPVALNNHLRWWNYVPGANWRHPEGPNSDMRRRLNQPSCTSHTRTLLLTATGPASDSPRKLNSNAPRAADSIASVTPGVMISCLLESTWRIPFRVISRTPTLAKTGTWQPLRWVRSRVMGMVRSMGLAMCGSGHSMVSS
jgi:hypothetical protein